MKPRDFRGFIPFFESDIDTGPIDCAEWLLIIGDNHESESSFFGETAQCGSAQGEERQVRGGAHPTDHWRLGHAVE
jgi:hypothetical protein